MATTFDQLTQTFVLDESCKNYGVSDIAAGVIVKIDATNFVGDTAGDVLKGIALPSTGGDPSLCFGITMELIKAGGVGRVRTLGIATAIADGSITVGTTVDASASVAGRAKAHTGGKASIGFARSGASDGDPVSIFILPSLNA